MTTASSFSPRYYSILFYIVGLLVLAGHTSLLRTSEYADHNSIIPQTSFGRASSPLKTSFVFSKFQSIDDLFVDQRLIELTSHESRDLVVMFVDTTYLETFGVWLDNYKRHDNSGRILSIFAVSEMAYHKISAAFCSHTTQAKLGNIGETLLVNLNPGKDVHNDHHFLDKLWVVRLQIMRRIINTFPNINVLYTDADAIWLKDPVQLYNHPRHLSSNIVASRGTYPDDCPLGKELHDDPINHLNTVTICFGFTYFRNSPDMQQLTHNLENAISRYSNDDQVVINCVLSLQYGTTDNVDIHDPISMAQFTNDDKSIIRSFFGKVIAHNIKVSLLPYAQVTRRCDRDMGMLDNAVVAHCFTTQKEGQSKIQTF